MGADGKPQYLISVIRDLTMRKRHEQRIAHMAHHDPLTDLPNRTAFNPNASARRSIWLRFRKASASCASILTASRRSMTSLATRSATKLLAEVAHRAGRPVGGLPVPGRWRRIHGYHADRRPAFNQRGAGGKAFQSAGHRDRHRRTSTTGRRHRRHRASRTMALTPQALIANADAALYQRQGGSAGSIRFFEPSMDEATARKTRCNRTCARRSAADPYQPQAHIDRAITGFQKRWRWHHPRQGAWFHPAPSFRSPRRAAHHRARRMDLAYGLP